MKEVIIDNIQKVYMSEDLAKSSDFFLAEGKDQDDCRSSSHFNEDRSSDELKPGSIQFEVDTPEIVYPLLSNDIVQELKNSEEKLDKDFITNIDSNFDYDITFRSNSYDETSEKFKRKS